jgi:phospholipid/cholesterol/gamma-HCH transport system permease protein
MFAAMGEPAGFSIKQRDGQPVILLDGAWTSTGLSGAEHDLRRAIETHPGLPLDLTEVERCDTAGAYAILAAANGLLPREKLIATPEVGRLLELVEGARREEPPVERSETPLTDMFARLGAGVFGVAHDFWDTLGFNGRLTVVLLRSIKDPRRFRWAPFISLAERAGLDALPIVAVTSFFIGAVIAFIGADLLSAFSLQVFTVELVGVSQLREFGVVITAVLLAGRSASSFAAEIGSMKMNQEIDAMQVMGVDPFEALVMPRFMALLVTIPLLTFIAVLAGLFGGMLVAWWELDLSPVFFVQRISETVGAKHFWVGMSKAPVMATVIASIGCRQGMEVGGDVESLGRRVTAAVVHAIFSIILLDAIFAMIYTELHI